MITKEEVSWGITLAETTGLRQDGLPAGGDDEDDGGPCRCDDCTLLRLAAGGTE